mgnify:CR=1 FL=1
MTRTKEKIEEKKAELLKLTTEFSKKLYVQITQCKRGKFNGFL